MKKTYIYINYSNIVVIKAYLEVVKSALKKDGYECSYITSFEGISKDSLIVYPMAIDAFRYYFKGYHNFVIWQQGATADESFMRNHSKLRYWLLNKIDTFAMRKACFILYVSEYMRDHYEKLAGKSFHTKSYIMPCFNEEYDESIYKEKNYSKMVFTYVGSLDLWQCFEKTASLYKQIEERKPNALFKILTFSVDEAKKILEEKGIKNYIVKCVPKEEIKRELIETTFGFILRDDNVVNRVATPTKFSSYLASGVIPIFSDCLYDFSMASEGMKNVLKVSANYKIEEIMEYICSEKSANSVNQEFKALFNGHYSPIFHIDQLSKLLLQTIK